jgi:PAS domain-containing protein
MVERARLEQPESPVHGVLDWIDGGCMLFDTHLDCVYANEQASALLGLARDHLVGRSLHSPFPTGIASEFQRAAVPAFENGTRVRTTLHDEPTGRWLEAWMHPSSEGLLAIVSDISARKRAELELAAHAEYLQQLVDQIPAFLWVIDRDLIVRRIEGGRPMMEALDRDRLVGLPQKTITEMGCNAEDTERSLDMHRRALQGLPGEYRATWKGITLEARIRPLRDRDDHIEGIVGPHRRHRRRRYRCHRADSDAGKASRERGAIPGCGRRRQRPHRDPRRSIAGDLCEPFTGKGPRLQRL